MYHVAVDGRKTVGSALPSISKSPTAGRSPLVPNGNEKNEKSSLRSTYQNPVDGRQNVISVFPSPVKSPGARRSVVAPNCVANVIPVELRMIHHSATFGRKMPMSVLPSPSKSNGASTVGAAAPPAQNPEMIEKFAPVDGPPATG